MINKLGYRDSNPEMQESKSCALPFGDTPLNTSDIPSFIFRMRPIVLFLCNHSLLNS